MRTHRNTNGPAPLTRFEESLTDRQLLELCLESVSALNLTGNQVAQLQVGPHRPEMMLTLLTFAYASRIYGSEEIEYELRRHPTLRYICAGTRPDASAMRSFRKKNRAQLEQCLRHVLEQAWRMGFRPITSDFAFYHWLESRLAESADLTARERVRLAILADAESSDY